LRRHDAMIGIGTDTIRRQLDEIGYMDGKKLHNMA